MCVKLYIIIQNLQFFFFVLTPRFPERDYADFLLPESVPLFCLPSGVSVEHWDRRASFPLPSFSTFALTNERGICVSPC